MYCHQVQPPSLVLIITSLSLMMQGVSEASERPGFFKRIMEANVSGIAKAYAAAERLFGQLQVWQLLVIAVHTPGGLFFCS